MSARTLYFKTMLMDSQLLNTTDTVYSFFNENDDDEQSITSLNETEAVNWLLKYPGFRNFFLEEFFASPQNVKAFTGIKEPITSQNKKPGDIDLLLVDPAFPNQAIGFECKRVKSVDQTEEYSKINSIEKIRSGVRQASAYQSLGFYKSFLMIMLLDDGRALNDPNVMFRYGKTANIARMYELPWQEPLQEDVGIVFIKVNQMTGKHYNHSISIGICIEKQAKPLDQLNRLTDKIQEILKHPGAYAEV